MVLASAGPVSCATSCPAAGWFGSASGRPARRTRRTRRTTLARGSRPPRSGTCGRRGAGAAAAVAVVVVGVAVWQNISGSSDPGPPPEDRPYTVLAAMAGTADSVTRDAITFVLRTGLDASHVVQTVPTSEVERLLTLMDRPVTTPLDAKTAREMAERGISQLVSVDLEGAEAIRESA